MVIHKSLNRASYCNRKTSIATALGALVFSVLFGGNSLAADVNTATAANSATATTTKQPNSAAIVAEAKLDLNAQKLLPESVRSSKTLTVGMDATKGIPWAYLGKNGQIQGLTRDMADSLAAALGVKLTVVNTPFQNLIPGLQADRFQLTIAPMLPSSKRLKMLDMIGWIHGGSSFMVRSDSKKDNLSMSDVICGMVLGGVTGTSEAMLMEGQKKKCESDGKPAIQLHLFPQSTDNILALKAGRVDAISTSTAQIGYIASIDPTLKRSGVSFNSGISSMALAKNSPLDSAIVASFQSLIDSGVYDRLLKVYGLDDLAIKRAVLSQETAK